MPNITNFPKGKVGIGTENPTETLDVRGTLRVTGSTGTGTTLLGRDGDGNVSNMSIGSGLGITNGQLFATGGASGTTGGSGSTSQVAYWIGSTTLSGENNLWWDSGNDRLGIGTNNPQQSLHVAGSLRLTGSNGTADSLMGRDANFDVSSISVGSGLSLSGGTLSATGTSGGGGITSLNSLTGSTQTFSTGNTGSDFNISSVGTTHTFNIPTASSANRGLLSSTDWSIFNNKIGGAGEATRIAFWSGSATISSSSNLYWDNNNSFIGVGTSSPTSKLHVVGDALITQGAVIQGSGTTSAAFAARFQNSGSTDILVVRNDNRVGINTSSPNQTLEVAGTMRLTGSTGTGTTLMARDASFDVSAITVGTGLSLSGNTLTTTGSTTGTGAANRLAIWSSATELTNDNNLLWDFDEDRLGIGVVPLVPLHVQSPSNATIRLVRTTTSPADFSFIASNSKLSITGGQTFAISSTGLGLGTDTPAQTLHVAGTMRLTGSTATTPTTIMGRDANGDISAVSIGTGLLLSGNELTATGGGGGGTITGSGTATQVAFWNGTSSLTGSTNLYWDNGNNRLGIGTSSPSNQLTTTQDILIATNITAGKGGNNIPDNTAFGVNALINNGSLASGNTAFGFSALTGSTGTGTGSNTAIGKSALRNLNTGFGNVAVGSDALSLNTVGGANVAVGRFSLGGLTTANSSQNVAIGSLAGYYYDTGFSNVTTSTNSIFIGANTRAANISPSNQIVIGQNTLSLGDNTTTVGTTGTTQSHLYGNLTLGLTTADAETRLKTSSSTANSGSFAAKFQDSTGMNIMVVRGDDRVGINTSSPNQTLEVAGTMRLTGSTATNATTVMGRDGSGDISAVSIGSGLSLSGNVLSNSGVTGSGVATRVAFWSGATGTTSTALTSNSNLYWDNTNERLGIGTSTPASPLNVFRSTGAEIRSSVTNAFCSFTAVSPAGPYPRAAFLVGNSASDVNTGMIFAPAFDDKAFGVEIRSYLSGADSRSRNSIFYNHPTNGFLINTSFGDGNTGGLPIVISTRDYSTAYANPAIYVNTFANSQRVGINSISTNAQLHVKGAGATSSTTAFLLQNSGSTNLFQVLDNGATTINGTLRLTNSTGTNATTVMGRDGNGDVSAITVGSGLSLAGNTLNATGGTTGSGTATQVAFWSGATGTTSTALTSSSGLTWDGTNQRLGVRVASPTATLNLRSSSNGPIIGTTELSSGYTGTNWTGSDLTWTHTPGSTATLTATVTNNSSGMYRVVLTVTGRTAGTFDISLKGITYTGNTLSQTLYFSHNNTNNLVVTPSNDFDGTITFAINAVNRAEPVFAVQSTGGFTTYEQRVVEGLASIIQGTNAGAHFGSGGNNIFLGDSAGFNSVTVNGVFAQGTNAGRSNINGSFWFAQGQDAGRFNRSGSNWIAQGAFAGRENLFGSNWIALGFNAGRYLTNGTSSAQYFENSIYIGANTLVSSAGEGITTTNEIAIGHQAVGLGSNTSVLGNTGTTQTHLHGNLTLGLTTSDSTTRLKATSSTIDSTSFAARFQDSSGTNILVVRGDGRVGIGTSSPNASLQIDGLGVASGTSSLLIRNSGGTNELFRVRDDGMVVVGANTSVTTQNSAQISVFSASANTNLVLTPKGTGAFIVGPAPNGAVAGGNARGTYAVDLQQVRNGNIQVASGANSGIFSGQWNRASGQFSVVSGGEANSATGDFSMVIGGGSSTASGGYSITAGNQCTASALYSFASGLQVNTALYGSRAYGSGQFSGAGDAMTMQWRYRRSITGTGVTELTLDGAAPTNQGRAILPSNRLWNVKLQIAAICSTAGGTLNLGDSYGVEYNVLIKRIGDTTSLIGTPEVIGTAKFDTNMASSIVTISADDTIGNESLKVEFTPPTTSSAASVIRVMVTATATVAGY